MTQPLSTQFFKKKKDLFQLQKHFTPDYVIALKVEAEAFCNKVYKIKSQGFCNEI